MEQSAQLAEQAQAQQPAAEQAAAAAAGPAAAPGLARRTGRGGVIMGFFKDLGDIKRQAKRLEAHQRHRHAHAGDRREQLAALNASMAQGTTAPATPAGPFAAHHLRQPRPAGAAPPARRLRQGCHAGGRAGGAAHDRSSRRASTVPPGVPVPRRRRIGGVLPRPRVQHRPGERPCRDHRVLRPPDRRPPGGGHRAPAGHLPPPLRRDGGTRGPRPDRGRPRSAWLRRPPSGRSGSPASRSSTTPCSRSTRPATSSSSRPTPTRTAPFAAMDDVRIGDVAP